MHICFRGGKPKMLANSILASDLRVNWNASTPMYLSPWTKRCNINQIELAECRGKKGHVWKSMTCSLEFWCWLPRLLIFVWIQRREIISYSQGIVTPTPMYISLDLRCIWPDKVYVDEVYDHTRPSIVVCM